MTFSGNVHNGTRNKWLHFGGDPTKLSLVTALAVCLGGGLLSPSASLVIDVILSHFVDAFIHKQKG